MKQHGFVILCSTVALTALVITTAWINTRYQQNHQRTEASESLEREAMIVSRLVQVEADALSLQLRDTIGRITAIKTNPGMDVEAALGEFSAVALLHSSTNGQWEPEWLEVSHALKAKVTDAQLRAALKQLSIAKTSAWAQVFERISDPLLSTSFAFLIPIKKSLSGDSSVALAILPQSILTTWSEVFKGSNRDLIIVDDHGYALALSDLGYVGTLFDKHPFVSQALSHNQNLFLSETRNLEGHAVLGAAVKLERTNLFALVSKPIANFGFDLRTILFQDFLIWLATAVLVGVALTHRPKELVEVPVSADHEPIYIEKPMDRMDAYKIVGPSLVQAMSGPISMILGHTQLAKSKNHDSQLTTHHEALEKEGRRLRDTLDGFSQLCGMTQDFKTERVDVEDLLAETLANLKARESKNLEMSFDLSASGQALISAQAFKDVLTEVLSNARDAMEGCAEKKLNVRSILRESRIEINIEDTGCGIALDQQKKIFDPFYSTKDHVIHAGLGLTMAREMMRGFGGDLRIESEPHRFTKVILELPLLKAVTKISEIPVEPQIKNVETSEADEEWEQLPRQLLSDMTSRSRAKI